MVSAADARAWRPVYRDLKDEHFVKGFDDALQSSPPGSSSAFESLLGPTKGALQPCDLATVYGLESTFGTDPGAYTGDTTVHGGFQMKDTTAERWGLDADGSGGDDRVEWRGAQLSAVESGAVDPNWYEAARDLDLAENVDLKPVVEAASRYLFQILRSLTWYRFGSVLTTDDGTALVGPVDGDDPTSQWSAIRVLPGDGGLAFVELPRQTAAEKPGDDNWIRITDEPTGATAASVYDALVRETVRYRRERDGGGDGDFEAAVSRFRTDLRLVAALKAFMRDRDTIPGSSVGTDLLAEFVEDVAAPLRRDLTAYVEHVLVEEKEAGVGPPRMDVAVEKAATTESDVRKLAYAGYNGGWIRLLAARFQAHLLDVGENGRGNLQGYASQWSTVSLFLHDEAREYAGGRMETLRPVLCGQFPPENAEITAVDFESSPEVVEIANRGSEELYLANWTLSDAAGNSVRFDEPAVLDPGATAAVDLANDSRLEKTRASPALNDEGGDTVSLSNDAGDVISRFGYEIREIDRANDGETHQVFRNTTDESDETHWVEYDCGHRPAGDNRSAPFPGVASCGHCRAWTRRDVTVTRAWTEGAAATDDGQETLNRNEEETLEDVEEGEFYDEWRSRN